MDQGVGRSQSARHLMDIDEKGRGAIVIRNDRVSLRNIVGDAAAMVEKMTMTNERMVPIGRKAVVTRRRGGRAIDPIVTIAETKAIVIEVIGVTKIEEKAVGMKVIVRIRAERKVEVRRVIVNLVAEKIHTLIVTPMAKREAIKTKSAFIQRVEFIEMNAV